MSPVSQRQVFIRHFPATAGLLAIHHDDRAAEHAAVGDDSMVALFGDAGKKLHDQGRVGVLHPGADQLDRLRVGGAVSPDEHVRHAAAAKPYLISCKPAAGPGRYERRRNHQSLHQSLPPSPIHLGAFEGERKANAHGYDESYGAMKAMLSLIAVTAFLFVTAVLMGAA